MPGFDLARRCARSSPTSRPPRIGLVLLDHGVFSFGEHRAGIVRADDRARLAGGAITWQAHGACQLGGRSRAPSGAARVELALVRSHVRPPGRGRSSSQTRAVGLAFARRPDRRVAPQGPATPDHVIRTKRCPCSAATSAATARPTAATSTGTASATRGRRCSTPRRASSSMRSRAWCTVGRTAPPRPRSRPTSIGTRSNHRPAERSSLAGAAGGRYLRRRVLGPRAGEAGGPRAASRFRRRDRPRHRSGSGIGRACARRSFSAARPSSASTSTRAVAERARAPDYLGLGCDVTERGRHAATPSRTSYARSAGSTSSSSAGVFPLEPGSPSSTSRPGGGHSSLNLDANLVLMGLAHPWLKRRPRRRPRRDHRLEERARARPGRRRLLGLEGRAHPAGAGQRARMGRDGIRVNVVHPNAVFDTAIWTEEVLRQRAAQYGLSVDAYRRNNVLAPRSQRGCRRLSPRCAARRSPRQRARRSRSTAGTSGSSDR